MMCALTQVRHNDSEPTGVPPLMYDLLMTRLLSNQRMAGWLWPGNRRSQSMGALPLSYSKYLRGRIRTCVHPLMRRSNCYLHHRLNCELQQCFARELSSRVSE